MTRVAAAVLACLLMLAAVNTRAASTPVWIDTDPAIGEPERDVDDGLALVQAFHSPELEIKGVSVVFGNAALDRGLPIARTLVHDFGPKGLNVYAGAAAVADPPRPTEASEAIAAALRQSPMTILALGPMTNIATVLTRYPELRSRITRVIAVAGRRPGQRFTTGTTNAQGHRDFNFELDPHAFQVLLDSQVDVVLAPFEISSKIWIESADLDRLAASASPAARAIVPPAREWLSLWRKLFGVSGFNPFDTLAVAYAISADGFRCDRLAARIDTLADDVTEPGVQGVRVDRKPYLLAAKELSGTRAHVTYCWAAPAGFKADLLARLGGGAAAAFDHDYTAYARVLRDYVHPPRVDYAALKAGHAALEAAIDDLRRPTSADEQRWTRAQRLAFWINAYNLLTLRAIVDHYPIRSAWLTLQPRNSIRQIDGVWTRLTWQAAGRTVTLDDVEHKILRPEFKEPRIHFAINCASVSCPPLAREPYRAADIDAQLDAAAKRYFASAEGLQHDATTLRVSSILKWYGEDFVAQFAGDGRAGRTPTERAILGVVAAFAPPEAAALARNAGVRIAFLDYNWSLNDVRPGS